VTTFDRARFVKFLGMTGSKHDAEALAFIRRANEMLQEAGLTWRDVILADPKPAPPVNRPTPQQAHSDWVAERMREAEAERRAAAAAAGAWSGPTARERADEQAAQTFREQQARARGGSFTGSFTDDPAGPRSFAFGVDPGRPGDDDTGFAWKDRDGTVHVQTFARRQGKAFRENLEKQLREAGFPEEAIRMAMKQARL
jgi:hypothetical protein